MADGEQEEGPRSFSRFLETLAYGKAQNQASQALFALGALLRDQALERHADVTGELVLKLKFKASGNGGPVEISYSIATKEPAPLTPKTVAWLSESGNFVREDPRQLKLGAIREVPALPSAKDVGEKKKRGRTTDGDQ
jgi:hypothetical protein